MTTQTRFIRGTEKNQTYQEVIQHREENNELASKVDQYAKLSLQYQEEEKLFKDRTKDMKQELEALKAELTEEAKKLDVTTLDGEDFSIEFSGRNARTIDPKDLYVYFRKLGDSLKFFDYIKVQLQGLEDDFGKAVIDASGIVKNKFNSWSSIKIKPKKVS